MTFDEPGSLTIDRRLFEPESGPRGAGLQVLRIVIDGVQECNLRCLYCHPGEVWRTRQLDAGAIGDVLVAADEYGCLEVVLSGGEITMHQQLGDILQATHRVRRSTVTLISNATLLTSACIDALTDTNVTRICVSLDGVDNETHGSARGKNLKTVLSGLRAVQATGREITVISVAHQRNFRRLVELSRFLADSGVAGQHHLCATSYSGTAREHYPDLKLRLEDYFALQAEVDEAHAELRRAGVFLTFNSFWPATGQRSSVVDGSRIITLQQVVEQRKDALVHIRPDGEFRLAAISWGRETVGAAAIGNVLQDDLSSLMSRADELFRSDALGQLPRAVEAMHKFQVGQGAAEAATNALIDSDDAPAALTDLIPIDRLPNLSLFDNPLRPTEVDQTVAEMQADPAAFRVVKHASGPILVFNRRRSHVLLLRGDEWPTVGTRLAGLTLDRAHAAS
jgi:MoaA/NifB/PqqE/SkfB family radical SAM enzyme